MECEINIRIDVAFVGMIRAELEAVKLVNLYSNPHLCPQAGDSNSKNKIQDTRDGN